MAIGIAITPLAIAAVLFLLATPRARANGPAFLVGWLVGLGVVGGAVLIVLGSTHASHGGAPRPWVGWMKIALGVSLIVVAAAELVRRPTAAPSGTRPRWAERLETVRPPVALGFGAAFAGARPKNIILIVAGATAIAQTGISARMQGIAYAVFAAIATIGVAVPIVIYFAKGDDASETLHRLEQWMRVHSAPVISVLCLLVGVDLIGLGVSALT
ncbi:MAG TPA: GAP family protein [Acidimicrobiales bacterium]|nr:GAP family protein [Acidimicrobiales bacterium]